MRKIIRFLFASILGFIAFELVELWPVRPMWSKPFEKMAIVGFSPNEQFIFVLDEMSRRHRYERGRVMSFVKFEVGTGAEVQRTELSIPANMDCLDVSVSADCSKLLFHGDKNGPSDPDYRCYLFDSQTGQCIGGPWKCGDSRDVMLSPDARWICHAGVDSLTLVSTENGRSVFSSPIAGNRFGPVFLFSQDGSKLAALTFVESTLKLRIISVPSGELLKSFELSDKWAYLCDWHDNIISLKGLPGQIESHEIQSFRIEQEKLIPLDREPLPQIKNLDADYFIGVRMEPTIIIHARTGKAAWPEYQVRIADWCDEHLGTNWSKNNDIRVTYRFFDRQTAKFRLDIPADNITSAGFSNSGQYFASYAGKTPRLEMWNINPFPRWPWAFGTAFLSFIFVFFFPRLRRGSRAKPPRAA